MSGDVPLCEGLGLYMNNHIHMKAQKVYLPQQSQNLGESHPVTTWLGTPTNLWKLHKAETPRCPRLES